MITLLILDMAGTTIDEQNIVYKSVRQAILDAGYPVDLETVLLLAAGKEKKDAIRDVLKHLTGSPPDDHTLENAHNRFKNILKDAYLTEPIAPQPGAVQVLKGLHEKGLNVVLNTGYDRPTAEQLLARVGWNRAEWINLVVTASDVERSRPAPDMIHYAMRRLGVSDPAQVAKIGDSIVDIEEGLNARCGMVFGITTGAHTRSQLSGANPTAVLDKLEQLPELIVPPAEAS